MTEVNINNPEVNINNPEENLELKCNKCNKCNKCFYRKDYLQKHHLKYKDVKVGSPRWKQIMRHIKTFGNTMLWYEGFSGDNIESMGIQLNYPDEDDDEMEKMRDKRNKEMEQLISEKVYEETLSKEKACIQ